MARVGSALWLFKHEARMFFYNATFGAANKKATRQFGGARLWFWVVIALLVQALAFAFVYRVGSDKFAPSQLVTMLATAGLFVVSTLMLSSALRASVEALFERGDLDLLLSSPLPSRTIFTVRLAGIVVGVASIYLLLLGPFANAGLILGQFQWIGIYPTVISLAVVVSSIGMLLTLGLVRWLGVRRTRVVAQVLGALSGASIFMLSQLGNAALDPVRAYATQTLGPLLAPGAALGPDSLLWLPARGLLGSVWPMAVLTLAAAAVFWTTVHFTHGFFVQGLAQAVSQVRTARRPAGAHRFKFQRSLLRIIVLKEWRLIARDTHLISQVLLQLLYMVPMLLVLLNRDANGVAGIGAALVFLCSSLSTSLAWIVMSAEDAPDLLRSAPCAQRTVQRAKLMAVAVPVLALAALPLLWFAWRAPLAGLTLIACSVGATICAALTILWTGRPAPRSDFKSRARGNFLSGLFEFVGALAWGASAFFMLNALGAQPASRFWAIGAMVALAVAALVCLSSWLLRKSA